jgi:hypothetical protein
MVEVSFKGEASSALAEQFDCDVLLVDRGVTRLHVAGDAAIVLGILAQIDALGLELIAVRELDDGSPTLG